MEPLAPAASLSQRLLRAGDSIVLDFGTHVVGYLSLSLRWEGQHMDAPTRVKMTFGEVPAEVAEPFDPHRGWLSRAWLQDEVINIDVLPATIRLPRRYAFRYVKLEVIATSRNFGVRFDGIQATVLTSATAEPNPLPSGTADWLRRVDEVSIRTLRNCMQTVFEDGPKRDRRLWIGDLRLQALASYATLRNDDLVRRCLYLFAGLPREDGLLAACVFEEPSPYRGEVYILDYAALYGATVLEYARATQDRDTARALWPVVRQQMDLLSRSIGPDGVFAASGDASAFATATDALPQAWVFVDWSTALDRTAAMHAIVVYSLRQAIELARVVGAERDVADYPQRIQAMTAAARQAFWDSARGIFTSGPQRQVSWASQAWMVLSEIAAPDEAAAALRAVGSWPDAIRAGTPYLYHYVVEAMLRSGLRAEALDLIRSYWGGMVEAGADTFWEVYDPWNALLSPYDNVLINSYCHAWSCTPTYLVRQYGLA